jgi:hypothetical protein
MRGLGGIPANEEIWFTDYRYVNDPEELLHGIALTKTMLQRRVKAGASLNSFMVGFPPS